MKKVDNKNWLKTFKRTFKSEMIVSVVMLFLIASCLFMFFVLKSFGITTNKPEAADFIFTRDTTYLSEWYATFVMVFSAMKITKMLQTKKILIFKYTEYTFTAWTIFIFLFYVVGIIIGQTQIDDTSFDTYYRASAIHVIVPLIWLVYFFIFPICDQKTKKQVWLGSLQNVVILSAYLIWIGIRLIPNVADQNVAYPYAFLSAEKIGVALYVLGNILFIALISLLYVGVYYLNILIYNKSNKLTNKNNIKNESIIKINKESN
ncbi:hypothetical protein [Mycoplasma yeatsii]|uniref:hypothetical protein n=1 Tax=Mycoplasma yeatsii TaxID=51365 RepID=UPI0005B2506D|nr:hypothetical protein [Mycoplasma yeatsii]AJM71648.1 hypothetical protein MYE_00775 [Mycoplasma yeatsii GM274B]